MSTRHQDRLGRVHGLTLAALLTLGAPLPSQAAALARLDRSTTTPDQALTLNITSDGAPSGTEPDLAPLQADFQVLGTSSGRETTIINGRRSDQLRWDIRLQPRHAGRIEIPPIMVGPERTAALDLNVTEASPAQRAADGQHAFLEVDANPENLSPYLQQQVPYTVRLFYDGSVTPTQLDAPAPANAVVEQLGPDKRYTAIRHGQRYNVIERGYAVAPEKSGALVIPAPQFRGTEAVVGATVDAADPQDDDFSRMLANTPFASMPGMQAFGSGSPFAQQTRPITAAGRQVTLDVKPRPVGIQGDWLPAEQLSLHDSWAGGVPVFKVGEPVTRVITIRAKGLAASQIPSLPIALLANARVYPEAPENQSQTDGQSIYGISKQSLTYIPTQAGDMEVPATDLAWWDVHGNIQRHATLPAIRLTVAPGVAPKQSGRTPSLSTVGPTGEPHAPAGTTPARSPGDAWKLIAGLSVVGALVLLATFWLRRRRKGSPVAPEGTKETGMLPRRASAMRTLQAACAANAPRESAQALLDLARLEWPSHPPLGLSALAARIEGGRHQVLELDRCLYGGAESRWDGGALWQAVRAGLRPQPVYRRPEHSDLEPLYPQPAH